MDGGSIALLAQVAQGCGDSNIREGKPFPVGATRQFAVFFANATEVEPGGTGAAECTRKRIDIRKAFPILHRGRFVGGTYNEELNVQDVTWLSPAGEEMSAGQWQDPAARCLGMLLAGVRKKAASSGLGGDPTILLLYNAHAHFDVVNFVLPSVPEGKSWERLMDTNLSDSAPAFFSFGQVFAI